MHGEEVCVCVWGGESVRGVTMVTGQSDYYTIHLSVLIHDIEELIVEGGSCLCPDLTRYVLLYV